MCLVSSFTSQFISLVLDIMPTFFLNPVSLTYLQLPTFFVDFILCDVFKLHGTKAHMNVSLPMNNICMSFLNPKLKNLCSTQSPSTKALVFWLSV